MRVLLVSCYELGHPPLGVAGPMGALRRAGFDVGAIDLAVDALDAHSVRAARLIAISVPMHTALRRGVLAATQVRALAPGAHVCFYGLYAGLNAAALAALGAHTVLGSESETALVELARALAEGREPVRTSIWAPQPGQRPPAPGAPDRAGLPTLDRYARAVVEGAERLAGYVEASRGCLHHCRHCPIPPVYKGRFFVTPVEAVMDDV
ncbi:MAG TPA: CUAEP/CCAEP-tail radical SAM protein, partial [Polyangia bacterium]|nr:CUAEP/CCAEP-tail radical SAM protein [Polyangia bacterium]